MNRSTQYGCVAITCVALVALIGCRGKFGEKACDKRERVDVPANAALAIYYDNQGNKIGTKGEDMFGTEENKMCPSPDIQGPGTCRKAGYCVVNINGTDYCVKCP